MAKTKFKNKKLIVKVALVVSAAILGVLLWNKRAPVMTDKRVAECAELTEGEKIRCWSELVEETIHKEGMDAAFEAIAKMTDVDPAFASVCHDFVHILGDEAYKLFTSDTDFEVSDKTSYCAYGFYHGFMENLVAKSGDPKLAQEFCDYVSGAIKGNPRRAYLACYHGIGHGWTNVHDERLWGDVLGMVDPALKLCEEISPGEEELHLCATGIFDSISIGYYNRAYGLEIDENDPLWICKVQEEKFKKACYADMMPAIIWLGDYELPKALPLLETAESEYKIFALSILAENSVRFALKDGKDIKESVVFCRTLGKEEQAACFDGLVSGLMQFGPPTKEYEGALALCNEEYLTESEKSTCYPLVISYSRGIYSPEKVDEICKLIGDRCS